VRTVIERVDTDTARREQLLNAPLDTLERLYRASRRLHQCTLERADAHAAATTSRAGSGSDTGGGDSMAGGCAAERRTSA
jgi:hypothetical protein